MFLNLGRTQFVRVADPLLPLILFLNLGQTPVVRVADSLLPSRFPKSWTNPVGESGGTFAPSPAFPKSWTSPGAESGGTPAPSPFLSKSCTTPVDESGRSPSPSPHYSFSSGISSVPLDSPEYVSSLENDFYRETCPQT